MSDLFWPGDERAGDLFTARAFVEAMVTVEAAWLAGLVSAGIAPPDAVSDLKIEIDDAWIEAIATAAEATGNPVVALVTALRGQLADQPAAASWLHRGLTSQDVVDTALMLCARDTLDQVLGEMRHQVASLRELTQQHRRTLMAGRTLTQFAVPTTFGLKAATWLQGVLDAAEVIGRLRDGLRSQFGGAAGTMAATSDLALGAALPDPAARAQQAADEATRVLALAASPPWHTSRAPVTQLADGLTGCTDAWGRIATDVTTLSRPEIAEVAEPDRAGRGASSTMPQKRNPVLSTLIRRAALSSPASAAQLHLAAADSGDERPAGAWHLEWAVLHGLARHTAVAASQVTELLAGLHVDAGRMNATANDAVPAILAERLVPRLAELPSGSPMGQAQARELVLRSSSAGEFRAAAARHIGDDELTGLLDPGHYLGTTDLIIDAVLARADAIFPAESPCPDHS